MSRPKTATVRPTTSAGQLNQSFRPTTSGGLDCEHSNNHSNAEDDNEYFDSSNDYDSTDDSYDEDEHHQGEDDDDDVFAFAPPGLGISAVQVVPAPTDLPAPPPAALTAPECSASSSRNETLRESVYYYDQNSGAVYNSQGDLVQRQTSAPAYAHSTTAPPSVSQRDDARVDEKTSAPASRSTSIKWHPSTRGESGPWHRRCESSGKDSEGPSSPTSWSGHAGTSTPTSDSADLLRTLPSPCFSRAVELELEEDDDSPYPEVRASVSNVDDPSMPSITFRSLLLGLGLSALASAVNTFLSQRNPPIQIVAIIVQILAHPLGTVMANVLPIRSFSFRLPSLRKGRNAQRSSKSYTWSFNPGPWNIKEHTVVLVAATTGLNPSYSLSILLAQDLARFWDDRRSFLYGLLSVCAPQLIGLALAGFVREVLVEPASMIWPQNLSVSTVLNTLHAEEDAVHSNGTRRMSRLRFFNVASLIAFVVYFFPGYLFTALSIFNWVCWIWPTNVPVNVVFGAAHGLGASVLTFDWNQVVYLGSPLVIPWWAQTNLFAGFVMGIWIAAPILYFTNALYTAYLPILSGSSFDRFGQRYNVSIVSPNHSTLQVDAYANYSQVYISAGLIVAYFGGFALITAAVVHTTLYHGQFVWDRLRAKRAMPDDVHARLMRKYASVPFWWYGVVLAAGLGMSVFLTAAYSTHLPIWALGLAVLVPAAYMLPFGFIFAMSGLPAAVNLVSEILASWLLPGKPFPSNLLLPRLIFLYCLLPTCATLVRSDAELVWSRVSFPLSRASECDRESFVAGMMSRYKYKWSRRRALVQKSKAHLFLVSLYRNGFLVGANSPSLWPTISSVTVKGMWCFPLCTRNLSPTKLGRMVQLLAFVRIAVLFLSASARLGNATKKGPFHAERDLSIDVGNMIDCYLVWLAVMVVVTKNKSQPSAAAQKCEIRPGKKARRVKSDFRNEKFC